MGKTSIEWTDVSWPVVNGCRRASPGCGGSRGEGSCYAERLAATRLSKTAKYGGLAVFGQNGPRWTGETRLWAKDLPMPLRLRKHSRIFVADMGDLFYEEVPDHVIDRVFAVMAICAMRDGGPAHVFQVLTKRSARMRQYVGRAAVEMRHALRAPAAQMMKDGDGWWDQVGYRMPWPLPNVCLMVSAENQTYADARIPDLLATPAAVRGVSYEPALGPIDFTRIRGANALRRWPDSGDGTGIDWVIVGSESGPGARPMDVAWARSAVDQCIDANVAVFTKQIATPEGRAAGVPKGGNPAHWPPGVWPREFPEAPRG